MASVKADTKDLDKLQAQMKLAPREVRSAYRRGLKDIGNQIAEDAKRNIERISPEVAASIKVRTRMPATVSVQGGIRDKPIGRLLEGHDGIKGFWTHPLFGDERHRYAEERHPHLYPAYDQHKDEASDALKAHVTEALEAIDLHPED